MKTCSKSKNYLNHTKIKESLAKMLPLWGFPENIPDQLYYEVMNSYKSPEGENFADFVNEWGEIDTYVREHFISLFAKYLTGEDMPEQCSWKNDEQMWISDKDFEKISKKFWKNVWASYYDWLVKHDYEF